MLYYLITVAIVSGNSPLYKEDISHAPVPDGARFALRRSYAAHVGAADSHGARILRGAPLQRGPGGTIRARQPVGLVLAGEDFDRYPCDPGVFSLGVPILRVSSPSDCDALSDFLFARCECRADWNMDMFIRDAVADIERQVGDGRVLLGLSGGVDSAVTAALIHRAIGNRLDCVLSTTASCARASPKRSGRCLPAPSTCISSPWTASDRFLDKLAGVEDPERKRKIIGAEFIDVFSAEAEKLGRLDYLAQGIHLSRHHRKRLRAGRRRYQEPP